MGSHVMQLYKLNRLALQVINKQKALTPWKHFIYTLLLLLLHNPTNPVLTQYKKEVLFNTVFLSLLLVIAEQLQKLGVVPSFV